MIAVHWLGIIFCRLCQYFGVYAVIHPGQITEDRLLVAGLLAEQNSRFFLLRLPSWQVMYDFHSDQDIWHQLSLRFREDRGYRLIWQPIYPPGSYS